MMRRRRPFGLKGQLEMTDDPVDRLRFFDERDDSHPAATSGTTKRIHLVDLADHLGPAFGRHIKVIIFNNGGIRWVKIFWIVSSWKRETW
jgi:hypothetical protein